MSNCKQTEKNTTTCEPKATKYAGTQTEKNLEAAFAGESQARNKYTYFASVAKKKGMNRFPHCSLKRRKTKKSMQNFGLRN